MKQMVLKTRIFRAAAMLVCLAVLLTAGTATAYAYGRIDTGAGASLTAHFAGDGDGIEEASFRLYRVADVSDAAEFTLAGQFAGAPVSLEDMKSAGNWADMAVTLLAYAGANGISPDAVGSTGGDGSVSFSGLSVGLYLLAGDAAVVGDYSYTPTPSMIMLPALMDNDSWEYAPSVDVKYTKTFTAEKQEVTVKKVWDDGGRSDRPESVKIQLLRNGEVQETATLDADNNWTYTWSDLTGTYESGNKTKAYTWSVSEESVPEDYTVSVSQNGSKFTVTNTYKNAAAKPGDTKLPQTGTLNWPVPVLTVSGLLLMVLGWYLCGRKREN